ncbi:MAG: hypothetical protein H7Z16_06445 [Pyrinomonadaceae bacterium]|nr:hypothetical protein [Pyrinomonadaceae bacterium]
MSESENAVTTQESPSLAATAPPQILGLSQIVQTIKEVSEVADKRASTFLLALGGALIAFALVLKVKLFGLAVADMSKTEFVALLMVCFGCLVCGAYVRMLQERMTNEHGLRLLETSMRYSLKSQAKTDETAIEAHKLGLKPVTAILEAPKEKPAGG